MRRALRVIGQLTKPRSSATESISSCQPPAFSQVDGYGMNRPPASVHWALDLRAARAVSMTSTIARSGRRAFQARYAASLDFFLGYAVQNSWKSGGYSGAHGFLRARSIALVGI